MFRLMLDAGLRAGEDFGELSRAVAALRVSDLSIQPGSLTMGRLRVWGKGSKERILWLMPGTLDFLLAWLDQRPAVTNEALFITRRGHGISVRGIEERLAHYCRAAGVKVSPHRLRHTFGRRMAEAVRLSSRRSRDVGDQPGSADGPRSGNYYPGLHRGGGGG